jgi:hypothetical protein
MTAHTHSYTRGEVIKVPLRAMKGGVVAFDYFTRWVCVCGDKTPAKRERRLV